MQIVSLQKIPSAKKQKCWHFPLQALDPRRLALSDRYTTHEFSQREICQLIRMYADVPLGGGGSIVACVQCQCGFVPVHANQIRSLCCLYSAISSGQTEHTLHLRTTCDSHSSQTSQLIQINGPLITLTVRYNCLMEADLSLSRCNMYVQ